MSATRFAPVGHLRGTLEPPPDKSISHRAALLAAMANGESAVTGYLDAADTRSTLAAVEALGAQVTIESELDGRLDLRIQGIGLRGPEARGETPIDVGNSGTLLRLLPGWLAGQGGGGPWTLSGDESIARRPVDRVAAPLREMGGHLEDAGGLPPLRISPASLRGIEYRLPVASAQVKSCVLFGGLLAEGETTVVETRPSRDHTERMLWAAGVRVRSEAHGTSLSIAGELPGRAVTVAPPERLEACGFGVPGDFSSAAFFVMAALLTPGSRVRLDRVGLNPTRVGLLGILNRMGARIEVESSPPAGGEERGTLDVRHSPLRGTIVTAGEVPLAIDEFPLVALAAAFAEGETVVRGAAELRLKESDRIATVVEAINALGGRAEATEDGFVVTGTSGLRGGTVSSHGDHRLAMMGAVAGAASTEGVDVEGMAAAAVSYPGFERDLASLAG